MTVRPLVITDGGLVVAGHHKAAEAGAAMLRRGGNAMDAAVAAAATLAVAMPHMNGLGGDAFALWFDAGSGRVSAINGSGAAPLAATPELYRSRGWDRIPVRGPFSLSVPGAVAAWSDSVQHFGTRPFAEVLEPAIDLARSGIFIGGSFEQFLAGPLYAELVREHPPLAARFGAPGSQFHGARLPQLELARTLEILAAEGPGQLYGGVLGERLVADLHTQGALISLDDLMLHATRFDTPLEVRFRGAALFAAPPNSQGIALALLAGLDDASDRRDVADRHLDYLALKHAAFAVRDEYAVDPGRRSLPPDLLDPASLRRLAERARDPHPSGADRPVPGDTSALVVVDAAGNAVSWVQSLFEEFGSCVVSPATGIVLHNRLYLQSLDPDSNRPLVPGERPFHTLCPALTVREGRCELVIGTPGDHGQPQSIYQVLRHVYDGHLNLQEAIEAPRVRHDEGSVFLVEDGIPQEQLLGVQEAGYEIRRAGRFARLMGGINAIRVLPEGVRLGAADPRRDSYCAAA